MYYLNIELINGTHWVYIPKVSIDTSGKIENIQKVQSSVFK